MKGDVVIAGAVRTAIGSFMGSLAPLRATELGSIVIREALRRSGLDTADADVDASVAADAGAGAGAGGTGTARLREVDEVILGNVLQAGIGQNPARQAAILAGLPQSVPATTINKVCGSGLHSIMLAASAIRAGDASLIVAGGMESMSNAPYLLEGARGGFRMGHQQVVDSMLRDGLWCAFCDVHMGITAENIATQYGLTRDHQDEFAALSQQKAEAAITSGRFRDEIVPVDIVQRKGNSVRFDTDEFPRFGTTVETLGKLRPAFQRDGTVTAGNASGINDGAAAVVVASGEKTAELGLKPVARIISYASAGVAPEVMGLGPIDATQKALAKAGLSVDDMDLIEANEAFAAQSLAVSRALKFPADRVNVNGGAIALGHPIGASGARILVTLVHELCKRGGRYGLATLCIGGGQGVAMVIERI